VLSPSRTRQFPLSVGLDQRMGTQSNSVPAAATKVDRDQIFLIYALVESARALRSFDEVRRLAAIRETRTPGVEVRENQSIFDSIRMALQFSANVSKVFWPSGKSAQERGRRLRDLTGIPDDHDLKSRALRNHVEHMDERLDDWTANSPRPFSSIEQTLHAEVQSWPNVQDIIDSTAVAYMEADNSIHLFGEKFLLDDLRADVLDIQNRISIGLNPSKSS
jgi:hypothetical protein